MELLTQKTYMNVIYFNSGESEENKKGLNLGVLNCVCLLSRCGEEKQIEFKKIKYSSISKHCCFILK